MADDIQIKGLGGQNTGSNPTPQPSQPNPAKGQEGAPVIDLRMLDQQPVGGATTGSAPTPVIPPPTATAQTVTPTPKAKTAAVDLGGADLGGSEDEGVFVSSKGQKYTIPTIVKEKFPDLVQLIKETESMNDEEREYWYQILPIMTEDQIKKFRDILVNEKEQLTRLDKEYEDELTKLNEKHMIEWKEFETKEKRKTLTDAEQKSKTQEKAEEEDLLKRLSQV